MTIDEGRAFAERLRSAGRRVVFTNGVFDILHPGHVRYLQQARALGDALIVGLNSDASVRRNKGPERPINSEEERACRCDDDPRGTRGKRVQHPRARRGDVHVGRKAAIGIHLVRREGEHRPVGIRVRQPLECRQEEPDVPRHALGFRVGLDDEQHAIARGRRRGVQRLRR